MIQRVYEQAGKTQSLDKLVVATDNAEIFDHVKTFGGEVMMTSPGHPNGTLRCEEVLKIIEVNDKSMKFDLVINIQGDEPYIEPSQIDKVVSLFSSPLTEIGTLVKNINSEEELFNPNVVKAVIDTNMNALYFSRQTIPLVRDYSEDKWLDTFTFYKHIGIYGYRAHVLKKLVKLEPGKLETAENLEQLRWLENGFRMQVEVMNFESIAIDTPEDLLKLTNNN